MLTLFVWEYARMCGIARCKSLWLRDDGRSFCSRVCCAGHRGRTWPWREHLGHPFPGALFSMFQALPGFYFLYFAFQCWRLNSGLHIQVSSTVHWVPDPALWKKFPPPSIISLLFPLVPPTQLLPETFELFFYESIMSIPEMNPYATPFLQDLPSRVLRDTPPHTPVPVNAPHLTHQHSPLEEMPNHDYH